MLTGVGLLRLAFLANIVILVPICWGMFFGSGVAGVFEGKVEESPGLRLLVGSLWFAILLASVAGLYAPRFFAPVVLIQIVYKSLWLLAFILPLVLAGKSDAVPWGIATTFLLIVLSYPFLFWYSGVGRAA
ncbi:MAG: hypothetical protein AAGE37_09905 [Pseudomonadota bacterium]